MADGLTVDDIAFTLAAILAGAVGGTHEHWAELIGPVKMLPLTTNIHCNWSISPIATGSELEAISKAAELLRGAEPYVS